MSTRTATLGVRRVGHSQAVGSDHDLWNRLRSADQQALTALFHRYSDAVYNFAFRRTSSWSAAEDIVQATFTALWRRALSGKVDELALESARPLLLVMAGYECRNVHRSSRRQAALLDRIEQVDQAGAIPDHAADAADRVDDERAMSEIRRIVDRLPGKQREVVELVVWSECSMAEAARALGKAGAITHAIRVKGWNRTNPTEQTVALLDKSTGLLNACVGQPAKAPNGTTGSGVTGGAVGGDPAAGRKLKSVFNPTDATHPAVPTDNGGSYLFVKFDKSPDLLVREAWYRTDDRVAAIRQRYVIKGRTGPWYVANASDGLVFLRSWDGSAVLQKGDAVRIETQVVGRNGELLDAPADQKGGGGLTPSPGTTRVDIGKAAASPGGGFGTINFGH